jgi:hypothetical protein
VRAITSQREQYVDTVHLFIGTERNPDKITFVPLITNHDYNTNYQGLCSLFLFKSVPPFVSSVSSCRSSFSCSFSIHLHVTPACLLSCRRCFCLEDLRRRRRPPKGYPSLAIFIPCFTTEFLGSTYYCFIWFWVWRYTLFMIILLLSFCYLLFMIRSLC